MCQKAVCQMTPMTTCLFVCLATCCVPGGHHIGILMIIHDSSFIIVKKMNLIKCQSCTCLREELCQQQEHSVMAQIEVICQVL